MKFSCNTNRKYKHTPTDVVGDNIDVDVDVTEAPNDILINCDERSDQLVITQILTLTLQIQDKVELVTVMMWTSI